MVGTVMVEFAGTVEEARDFCVEHKSVNEHLGKHKLVYAQNKGKAPNGFPYLSIRYGNAKEYMQAIKIFESLGWERGHLITSSTSKARN